MSQLTLVLRPGSAQASLPYLTKKKVTKRERFLDEMEKSVPWEELLKLLRKLYLRRRFPASAGVMADLWSGDKGQKL